MNKLPANAGPDYYLNQAIKESKRIVKDLYGRTSDYSKMLQEKLERCKTLAEVDNTMIWGRVNAHD